MPEAAVLVETASSSPQVTEENRKKSFSLNVGVFLLLWVGLHLLLRAMGWVGDSAILIFVPALYGAYYLVRAVLLLYFYHYKLSLLALGVAVLYLLIGVKFHYLYHNLLAALLLISVFTLLIQKGVARAELARKFRKKLSKLITLSVLVQLIPNQFLFGYYNYEQVLWHEHITWQDFQAAPDTTSPYAAGIATTLNYKVNRAYNYPQAIGFTQMNPKESWCVAEDRDGIYGQFLLDHEQLHFDITEVWRRKTSDSVAKVWGRTPQDVQAIINYYASQEGNMQSKYDSLTRHGTDSLNQMQWKQLIKSQLNE